ncbi:bacillithiol biosynthesis cysteine-adding enzyme BshC [Ascidiimonas aurantiaca]|uniref:bacillithiol biosynthesis cysteine-adding enzyme BshC n=1 Tax=Ascidiimonas aurantiaca TaxID=1685432 RepID=UPI0030EE6727
MPADCVSFKKTGYFSDLICDYLEENPHLQNFYSRFPNVKNFADQIIDKKDHFSADTRTALVTALREQYAHTEVSNTTRLHLEKLSETSTFTVTTGHQLNLFTGPLYFLYKIISTINLCEQLSREYPEYHFVPVYWMATEDHDFEEINFFNFKGKKIQWHQDKEGAVGRLSTEGLSAVFERFSADLGTGKNANALRDMFTKAYLEHDHLSEATRYLANTLFGEYGLLVIDGDSPALKRLFEPYMKEELLAQSSYTAVMQKAEALKALNYSVQVNPREINLFYLDEGLRKRIVRNEHRFEVLDTDIYFTREKLLEELSKHPERFSPNVVLRPLYQEVILPNLCYIGGGGELAYWLELKEVFNRVQVPFPILLLRNSALLISEKQAGKLKKLEISYHSLFLKKHVFENTKVKEWSDITIDLTPQKNHLKKQFEALHELARQTDASFLGAVNAQEVKQLKGLENLEKRLVKAQKRKLQDRVSRSTELQDQLFPGGSLQERNHNFSEYFLEYGPNLIQQIKDELDPLHMEFYILLLKH